MRGDDFSLTDHECFVYGRLKYDFRRMQICHGKEYKKVESEGEEKEIECGGKEEVQ